jgi:hypothetical protein
MLVEELRETAGRRIRVTPHLNPKVRELRKSVGELNQEVSRADVGMHARLSSADTIAAAVRPAMAHISGLVVSHRQMACYGFYGDDANQRGPTLMVSAHGRSACPG